jgi:hypothetical protein
VSLSLEQTHSWHLNHDLSSIRRISTIELNNHKSIKLSKDIYSDEEGLDSCESNYSGLSLYRSDKQLKYNDTHAQAA